jgi:hypothetical protein
MPLKNGELSPADKLYDMIDKVVIVKGAILSDPTIWEFHIQGKVLKVDTENLENMSSFRKQFLKAFDRPAPKISSVQWPNILEELAEDKAEYIQATEETGNVFIARQMFEIICELEISDDPEDAISGMSLFKHELEDDHIIYCCMPSPIIKNKVDESGFKIPLNELSTTMTDLKMKRAGTPAVRYGKGRRQRTWCFFFDPILEEQKEG